MGMDIYAVDPINPELNYWRSGIFGWSELGGYIYEIAGATIDTITPGKAAWFSNSGELFDEEACTRIAAEVRWHIEQHGLPDQHNHKPNPTQMLAEAVTEALTGGGATLHNCRPTNALANEVMPFVEFLENSRGIRIC